MVSVPGLLEHMGELVWGMSVLTADQLRANPMALAHCIGAMKIVAAISISEQYQDSLAQAEVLSAVLALLQNMSNVTIKRMQKQAVRDGKQAETPNVLGFETPVQEISAVPEKGE